MERKKGFQWYRTLTKKQQKQFRLNCHRCEELKGISNLYLVMNEIIEFYRFIDHAFVWENTPQGYQYWEDIATSKD